MDEKHFTPYAIVERDDGLVDLLFPREGCQARCPCHDRLTVRPRDGLEEDLRRNYDSWRARAQSATCDRQGAICAYDQLQAKGGDGLHEHQGTAEP